MCLFQIASYRNKAGCAYMQGIQGRYTYIDTYTQGNQYTYTSKETRLCPYP